MPRTEENGIQHGHAELENKGHLWDDTLFMTVLFLAKAGVLLGREEYVREAEYQFLLHAKYLTDLSLIHIYFFQFSYNPHYHQNIFEIYLISSFLKSLQA